MKTLIKVLSLVAAGSTPLFAAQVNPCEQNATLTGGTTLSITGSNAQKIGTITGTDYHYEVWHNKDECSSTNNMTYYGADQGGGAAFKANWTKGNTCDFLARIGYKWDVSGKSYKDYEDIFADYNYTRSGRSTAGDYSYIGIYGWVRKTNNTRTVEYYIVDDWFGNQWQEDTDPVGPNTICPKTGGGATCSSLGTLTIDGGTYDIYKNPRTNAYSIDSDNDNFDQYFSVRRVPRKCGTISVTEHFKKWEEAGLPMSGTLYEAKLLAEAGGGAGSINYTYARMRLGGGGSDGDGDGNDDDGTPIINNTPLMQFSVRSSGKALLVEANVPATIIVYNLKGKKQASFNVSGTQTINLSLPSGMYFAKVHGVKTQHVKFIVK